MIHMMMNVYWEELEFEIPRVPELDGRDWKCWLDTSRKAPYDICLWDEAAAVRGDVYPVQPRSLVILFAQLNNF